MSEQENFEKAHQVGFLKVPRNLGSIVPLAASKDFMAPTEIVLRGRCTPTEDQGSSPMCAAYSAAQWAENIQWMRTGSPLPNIDPKPIYRYAKTIDDDPTGDGTTITAALEGLLSGPNKVFDRTKCRVRLIRANRLSMKYAIHKFGCCLAGFNITDEWYRIRSNSPVITGERDNGKRGGHCVIVCGYDKKYVYIQNSWGSSWGEYGFAKLTWKAFDDQFLYGGVISNVLDGMTLA